MLVTILGGQPPMMHVSHLLLQCVKLGSKHRLPVVAPNLKFSSHWKFLVATADFFFFLLTQTQWHKVIQNCTDSSCFLTLSSFIELHPLTNWFLSSFLSKRRHHSQNITVILVVLRPCASLRPVAVKVSSFGGMCCRIVALTCIFCLILTVDSRGDRGKMSVLHKSKLLQSHHAVSSRVPLCARRPQAGQEHWWLPRMAPGSVNLVARGWFYVAIGDVATVNFTHCNSIMHSNAEK